MRMQVRYLGRCRFEAEVRGHRIGCDQPADAGGEDLAPTPPELLAASLAGCVGFYVARYCQQAGIDADGLTVEADWQVGGSPRRIERFVVRVHLSAWDMLPEGRRRAIERAATGCLIHNTLSHPPEIAIEVGA